MSTYRINGIKYNPANWATLDPSERAACNRFAAARERELNTITATAWKCQGGPFTGHAIELESTTSATAHMTVGAWIGRYELQGNKSAADLLVWVGNDGGQAINVHATAAATQKPGAEVTARGFDQLRDLLADLAEDPTERETTTTSEAGPTKPRTRYTIGRTVYTIEATTEAADRLRARILKAKRWFADKLLTKPAPAQHDEAAPGAPAIIAASVAIATAQAQAAETCAPGTADTAEESAELVTCDGPELTDTAAAAPDTPAASCDAIGADHTPTENPQADDTDPRETRAQAGDYTQQPAPLRADYLRAAESGNTQQAGSKIGAWSAVMFRTADGRAGLAFKRPGHPVELVVHATGGERMRALQAMAQAAEQAAATNYNRDEADKLSEHGRNFTAAQCEQVAANFERDNNHGAALVWRCMGAKAYDLAARAGANTMAHNKAGQLTPDLADQRAAIAAELKARQQASGTHTPWASSTEPGDYTAPLKTQAADCTTQHETPADTAPEFQRARPAHVDLRSVVAQGLAVAELVGLGVYYTGDMANSSGNGAIVEATDDGRGGLYVCVTLEDGRHMTHLHASSFADSPGSRFALDYKRHGAPYLAELAATRATLKATTTSAKEIGAQRHAAELVRLAEEFPHLERADSRHGGGKMAARNIRTMLKAAFPGQKFSVTSDYSSVNIRWTDGPTDAAVTAIVDRFNIGRADYNTDYFYTEDSAWSELFGGVQYLLNSIAVTK